MDLDTIRKKINACYYQCHEQFVSDIQLIWDNAKLFNTPDSYVYKQAIIMEEIAAHEISKLIEIIDHETQCANDKTSK